MVGGWAAAGFAGVRRSRWMPPGARDDLLRAACFAALDRLRERFGDDVPRPALQPGFAFDGGRVPFLNWQKGIFRARRQGGPAALSVQTSVGSPYDADRETDEGFWYAYRAGPAGERDNSALREAAALAVPLAYFRSFRPGSHTPIYPVYVERDDPIGRRVLLTVGRMAHGEPDRMAGIQREYAWRESRVRLHQSRFRGIVLPAYADRCAICRLRERRLLDAAHIRPDAEPDGLAAVTNGLSLCTIHHRAYDQDLVGIDADHRVHVAARLLEDEDGPMLDLLKTFHGREIIVPRRAGSRPDRELLAERFERFAAA